jgi:hypothetical protein
VKRREPRLADLDETPIVPIGPRLAPERVDAVLDAAAGWLAGHPRPRVMCSDRSWVVSDEYRVWQAAFSVFLDGQGLPFMGWQLAAGLRAARRSNEPRP